MTNQINLDTRGVLTVQDQAGQPVKIVIKLAGKGYGNGRIVGDRQYQICRYVPTINDRRSPGPARPPGALQGRRRRLAGLARSRTPTPPRGGQGRGPHRLEPLHRGVAVPAGLRSRRA